MDLVLDNWFIISPLPVSVKRMALRKMDSNSLVSFSSFHPRTFFASFIGPQGEESGAYYSHIGPGSGMKRFGLEVGWQRIGPRVWRCRGRWPQILTSRKAKASVSPFLPILWELTFITICSKKTLWRPLPPSMVGRSPSSIAIPIKKKWSWPIICSILSIWYLVQSFILWRGDAEKTIKAACHTSGLITK